MSAHDLVELEAWQSRARCAGAPDPGVWFPERGADVGEAKKICALCPVKAECLRYALEHRIQYGIWGGASERQRRRMVKPPRKCRFCGDLFTHRGVYCNEGCAVMARGR